ncbi:unnamed protein product [Trichobilharzia regenti]|nr:unnamed protein product [Trichobilharzia regenti]
MICYHLILYWRKTIPVLHLFILNHSQPILPGQGLVVYLPVSINFHILPYILTCGNIFEYSHP